MSMSNILINLVKQQHHYHQRCLIIGRSLTTQANQNKASLEQLASLEQKLALELPKFFSKPINISHYTKNVVFIDNTRSIRVQGVSQYMMQLQMIKLYHNLRYAYIKVELLNLVKNPEESYLRIRWRLITKPGILKNVLFLMKPSKMENWRDGISTMHVNSDGKIYCHVCDNIDVDTNDLKEKQKSVKNPLVDGGLSVCNKPKV